MSDIDEHHEQEKAAADVPIPSTSIKHSMLFTVGSSRFSKKQKLDEYEGEMFCEYSDSSYEEDEDLPLECTTTIQSASGPSDSAPFEVLNSREIDELMTTTINKYASIINLPYTTTRVMLSHFKWDGEKLTDKYFGCSDSTQFLKDAGIPDEMQTEGEAVSTSSGTQECEICCTSKPSDEMYGMTCSHNFCKTCWSQYITRNVNEGQMGQTIQCPAYNCSLFLDDTIVTEQLLTDYAIKCQYRNRVRNNFVETHKLMCWCPSPDCTYALRVQRLNVQVPVKCICGYTLCFKCGNDWHDPAHCEHLKKWLIKCADDSETLNWMFVNTRNCPTCHTKIEKNGGCNHMICGKCKSEFCWHCNQSYEHQRHACNKFIESSPEYKAAEKSIEEKRVHLQRYVFYSDRYRNHMDSLKLEKKLRQHIKEKMQAMLNYCKQRWVDVQFLAEAVDVLNQCRQVLMYCCVFAFYIEKSNDSLIFEDNQGDLENACEKLSGFLESEKETAADVMSSENISKFRQQVQDLQKYCESRKKVLLDHAKEGYEKGVWGIDL